MNPRTVIWFAIVFSTVLYLLIAVIRSGPLGDFEAVTRQPVVLGLYGAALAAFLAGWLVVRQIVSGPPRMTMVAALAVFESCAIFGLVAAFLTSDWRTYLGPWALALIGFLREWPGREGTDRTDQ
jgi:hypothetical protein